MPMISQELASTIIKKSRQKGADLTEVFISDERSLKIDVLNQKIESSDNLFSGGIGLRVIKNNRLGFAYTANIEDDAIDEMIGNAIANSRNSHSDIMFDLPDKAIQHHPMTIYDKTAEKVPYKEKLKIALDIEKSAYEYSNKIKKTEKVTYSETFHNVTIANSKGVNTTYKKSMFGGMAEILAEENGLVEAGYWFKFDTLFGKIEPKIIGQTAAKRAADLLGAKPIKSRKMCIILTPFTAGTIIGALSPTLSAESIIKGKSLFIGKLGLKVASPLLTLVDNGALDHGIGSSPCDDEGHPTEETILINKGMLSNFLYDTYTAKKLNKRSTGNGVRQSFKAMPEVSPTNLYIKNGTKDDMLSQVKFGLVVDTIIGAHTINPISGDFSIGAVGHLVENGQRSIPVRGITIAGNLIELLNKIEDIGSDLEFLSNIGSPSILISDISVSGH